MKSLIKLSLCLLSFFAVAEAQNPYPFRTPIIFKDSTTTPYEVVQLHKDNDTLWSWIHRTGNNNPANTTIGLRARSHGTNETGTFAAISAWSPGNDSAYTQVAAYTDGRITLGGRRRPAGSAFTEFQSLWYDSVKWNIAGIEALRLDFDVRNQLTMLDGGFISRSNSTTFVPVVRGEFARTGTTAVQADDFLFAIIGKGYDGTDYETGGTMEFRTTENWSGSARGSQIEFYTVPNTSTTLTLAAELGHDQNLRVYGGDIIARAISNSVLPAIKGERARAGSTAVQSGDPILAMIGYGHNGTSFVNGTQISFRATETWSGSARGNEMLFYTTPNGSTTLTERMSIDAGGIVSIESGIANFGNVSGDEAVLTLYESNLPMVFNVATLSAPRTVSLPNATGTVIVSLNGISTQGVQTLATGTSGTDFAISSSGSAHTFNIPSASATARGLVTTGSQTFAGEKTFGDGLKISTNSFDFSDGTVTAGSGLGLNWTFPNVSGTVITTGNLTAITAVGTVTSGTLAGTTTFTGSGGVNTSANIQTGTTSVTGVVKFGNPGGGLVTLTAPASGGTHTVTLPSSAGTVAIGNATYVFSGINAVSPTSPNRTITVVIGGTTYYIHAKTTND